MEYWTETYYDVYNDDVMFQASVEGFCRELGLTEDEALNLIGRSVTLAKEAREWYIQQRTEVYGE